MIKLKNTQDEFVFTKIIDDEEMNMKIINRIDMIGDVMNHTTNVKADTTFADILSYKEFQRLGDIVTEFSRESSHELQKQHPNHLSRMNNIFWYDTYINSLECSVMWGTRYKSGEVTIPHNHWPNVWAFTYYIDPPEDSSGLYFTDSDYELEIEHGMLVLFNGNMIHEVKPSKFDGYRYCVAGTVVSNPPQKAL
jgi:hypothetical protein